MQHRGRIAKHYLQSWFLFDLFSSIPYEQLLSTDKYGVPSFVAFLKVSQQTSACATCSALWLQ